MLRKSRSSMEATSIKKAITIDDLDQIGACSSGVRKYVIENGLFITELQLKDASLDNSWLSKAFGINGSGDGSGDGSGSGYGYGYGYGYGSGSGYGSGDGYGDGYCYGDGYGSGYGDGSGDGYGDGSGDGSGEGTGGSNFKKP